MYAHTHPILQHVMFDEGHQRLAWRNLRYKSIHKKHAHTRVRVCVYTCVCDQCVCVCARVRVYVCVYEREREKERERERERERDREIQLHLKRVRVYVCLRKGFGLLVLPLCFINIMRIVQACCNKCSTRTKSWFGGVGRVAE